MKILVTGATGNVGFETTLQLAHAGAPAIAAVRNIEKARKAFDQMGVEPEYREFDYADPATWGTALKDVEKMFLVIPPGTTDATLVKQFFREALAAGVKHLVFNSGRTTGDLTGEPLNVTEGLIKNSGIAWTILRPGWFMQNFLNWVGFTIPKEDAFYLPAADAKTAFVDVRDIGAVAVEALTSTGHENKIYEPTGPEALNHYEVAQYISEAAGRTIRYVHLSDEEYVKAMMERGWTKAAAEHTVFLYSFVKGGKEERVSPDLPMVLGRPGNTFKTFAFDHAQGWEKVV